MELTNLYYQRFLNLLLDDYHQEFEQAKKGHCMKITGLALRELTILREMINDLFPDIQVYILSENTNDTAYITATKLIELRNEPTAPLLILIPSNSRTSTEDSYGNATFKNLNINHLNRSLIDSLKNSIPAANKSSFAEIFEYLKIQKIETIQYIYFMLEIATNDFAAEAIGNALHHLSLIPDSKLMIDFAQIRQRLMFNIKCIETLADFSQTISDRIAVLPIEPKTIQTEIAHFLKTETELKNKAEICWQLAEKYPHLNFANWPIPDIDNKQTILVAVDSMSFNNFKEQEGNYKLIIVPGKTTKIKLTISTTPAPKDIKELKYFRIVLWAIDGWSQVLEVKKTKVTEGPRSVRKVTVELSENIVEEGTYFLRVFAEDENGAILNTQDPFKIMQIEDTFKQQQELNREEFQYRHQVKYFSDTEDFYINIGQEDEVEGESAQRKDKLDNALQAFFKYRIEQIRNNREPDFPKLINESGVFLKNFQNSLQGTYYLKYSSNHNYQINISKKLYDLEHCFLKHAGSLGHIEAVLGGNPTDTKFQSLQFIALNEYRLIPDTLLKLRMRLFEAIQLSAPDSGGIFETFDMYQHIDLLREYIIAFEQWTRSLLNNLSDPSAENEGQRYEIRNVIIAIQNIDVATVQTKLPDGKDISVKLISPLHPLRLAWYLNLYDVFTDWENKTRENVACKWSKNLDQIFLGEIFPETGTLVLPDIYNSEYYQYAGELTFGWGVYSKPVQTENEASASNARHIKIYLSSLLNISNEYRIDSDVNQTLIMRHLKNYILQHPYTETLVINLFNVGDAYVFTNALIELEKQRDFKKLKYELRLFSEDDVIQPGEALRYLLNPESNISEEAEVFSQPSVNRLFPKLRFSINKVSDFVHHTKKYGAHLSFLINPFPVKTTLARPEANRKSFFFHSLVSRQVVSVSERSNNVSWNKYFSKNHNETDFAATTVDLFANMQAFVANTIAAGVTQSVPATNLELKEQDKFLLSFIHDVSDWVITFDKNMGPEIFDLPGRPGEIPFLLDFIPGQELTGIASYLTTRPTSEITGLLGPHFAAFGIDPRKDEETLKMLLEDLRTVSSSLILQLNSTENKAFEVLGTAFTKRVLDKKGILENAFLIPIDLHKDLFDQLPGENKKRADNLLVKIEPVTRTITFSIIEIKCRTSLSESERSHLIETMQEQIANTIDALRFHFDMAYQNPDRLDRELKTLELKSLLEFYINRATRYNLLLPQTQQDYLDFLEGLSEGYEVQFKKMGIIYDFSQEKPQLKEVFDENTIFFTFGNSVIADILDPDSDLNTARLERHIDDVDFRSAFDDGVLSHYINESSGNNSIVADNQSGALITQGKLVTPDVQDVQEIPDNLSLHSEESESTSTTIPRANTATALVPPYDIMIGKSDGSSQYGILGKVSVNNKVVALDLSETNTISLFGVQGAGKSYTIGTVSEMVLKHFDKINNLPGALAGVIFHYSESMDYAPEFTSMIHKNDKQSELLKLKNEYGAEPSSIDDVILLTPRDKIEERKTAYPSINVYPISFNSNELNVQDWMFLLGAIGNDSTYIKQLKAIMKSLRANITLDGLKNSVDNATLLSNNQKMLAAQRLQFASEYIDDSFKLCDLLKPGRLIIVDLRDEFIEKDEALGLFVVMLNIFSGIKTIDNQPFNKFIVFDEAHKYMDNKDLTRSIVTAIREMRHKGVSIMIASQDPPSLPNEIIELSSIVLLHKFNSPQWLKHIQRSIAQLATLTPADLSSLNPGEAFLWATKSSDKPLTSRPVRISTRPRVTKHGGETVKAI